MAKIIVYPTARGFNVLASWPHCAATDDAAWRPANEISDAKKFASELDAKRYIARWFPEIPFANFVIEDAKEG